MDFQETSRALCEEAECISSQNLNGQCRVKGRTQSCSPRCLPHTSGKCLYVLSQSIPLIIKLCSSLITRLGDFVCGCLDGEVAPAILRASPATVAPDPRAGAISQLN